MGLSDVSSSSVSLSCTRNMFSRYLPQCPEISHSALLYSTGVRTSWNFSRCSSRT